MRRASLADCSRVLRGLAARLDVEAALVASESPDGVNWEGPVDPARLAALRQEDLDAWFDTFGTDLTLGAAVRAVGLDWEVTADSVGDGKDRLNQFLSECGRYADVKTVLRVAVVKPSTEGALTESDRVVPYYFAASLGSTLSRSDERGFESAFLGVADSAPAVDRRLSFLVGDEEGLLRGAYVGVFGRDHQLADVAAIVGGPPAFDAIRAVRALTREMSHHEAAPRLLTPDFFALEQGSGFPHCRLAFARLSDRLVISSLANRTYRKTTLDAGANDGDSWTSVFLGARALEVALDDPAPVDGAVAAPPAAPPAPDPLLLFHWVHQDPPSARTKLDIVRRVVAAELGPVTAASRQELVGNSARILAACEVQLNVLVDGNVLASFERKEALEGSVRAYTRQVGDRIAALGKEVIDHTYRTVAVLVGVAVAYLLKPDQGLGLVSVAIVLYLAYVFFIRVFYIAAVNHEFSAEREAFDARWKRLEAASKFFAPDLVNRLHNEVQAQNQRYETRRSVVSWVYGSLIAIGIAILLGLWWAHDAKGVAAVRGRLLERQAEVFAGMGYEDIRGLPGRPPPARLQAAGSEVQPDLTAIAGDEKRTPVLVAFVPCSQLREPQQLARLRRLSEAAKQQQAELQLLTEAECRQAGTERASEWAAAEGLGKLKVWAW